MISPGKYFTNTFFSSMPVDEEVEGDVEGGDMGVDGDCMGKCIVEGVDCAWVKVLSDGKTHHFL